MASEHLFGADRICGVVAASTAADAARQIREGLRYTRTIELRFDWLANSAERSKLLEILRGRQQDRQVSFIATCRTEIAGGKFRGSMAEQLSLLRSAVAATCDWVDLEIETVESFSAFTLDLYTVRARRILSFHDFRNMPSPKELHELARRMESLSSERGFEAIKIAALCESLRDASRLLAIARERSNIIAIPMGDISAPARILALREGSALSYAPVEQATALGQITLAQLCDLYRARKITRETRVYGVIGSPIEHSLSPALHNAGFRARRMDAVYLLFRVTDLTDFLQAIRRLGIAGFSVTLPHKKKLLRFLDGRDALAKSIAAVNTVAVRANGKLFGYNTDSAGILRALQGKLRLRGSNALILGAGGAARTVAFTLARDGANVFICSRSIARARRLARAVNGKAAARAELRRKSFDVIINATPVGMYPREDESPLESSEINCAVAFDLIYRPQRTKFLQLAADRGAKTVSGLEMFLTQGMAQWEIWTGRRAPATAMRRAVLKALRKNGSRKQK